MAAVTPKPQPPAPDTVAPPTLSGAAQQQMDHLLQRVIAAKPPKPDSFVPGYGMSGGGDVQLQPGLYTASLIGPDVWPTESETELAAAADQLAQLASDHSTASAEAKNQSDQVFSNSWTAGEGAEAAQAHYWSEHQAHEHLVDVLSTGSAGMRRLSEDVGRTKRLIREAHDTAHREIEAVLKTNTAVGIAAVAPILTTYRTQITSYSAELRGFVTTETQSLTNKFGTPESPPKGGNGDGRGQDGWTGAEDPKGHSKPESSPNTGGGGRGNDPSTGPSTPAGAPSSGSRELGGWTGTPSSSTPTAPTSPKMPSLPSAPSAPGGGASPLSGAASGGMGPMSGLLGGANPAGMASNVGSPASSVQGQSSQAMRAAFGGDFGRGLAAASNAAGAMPAAPVQPVPQTPASPLAAPMGSASPAAAPATMSAPGAPAVSSAPVAAGGPMGVPAAGGGPGAQMTSYGSVLPPAAGAGAPALGGGAVPPPPPPGAVPPPPPGGAGATGLLPVGGGSGGSGRLGRDISMTDLESARKVVADLAAASSVVYPGLEWAVGVARGVSGQPELWIATNEGAGYVPAGVFVPRSMPLAARFDSTFDARWFGWFNPAETVLRAIQARGDAVSAVATTFMSRSDLVDEGVADVAVGVPAAGGPDEAEASQLLRSRSHRLETVAPGLYQDLTGGDPGAVEAYVRHVTQQAVFNCGPELSSAAQAVARAVVAGRWPSSGEWSALRDEYSAARLMAGSQRPGVVGIEDPQQSVAYQRDFAECRRLEVLICWENMTPADVVYAAWCAGVPTPSFAPVNA